MRVDALGKGFLLDGSPFQFRAVRYPLASERTEHVMDRFGGDLAAIAGCGYTVVSLPAGPTSVVQQAAASGLRFIVEFDGEELSGIATAARRERRRLLRELAMRVRRSVRQWHGDDAFLGVILRIPPALEGSRDLAHVAHRAADELVTALHDEDPDALAAWRSTSSLEGDCPAEIDFLIADFELEDRGELATALMACHCNVGDRPLVLGSVWLGAGASGPEPESVWLIDTALRCGAAGTLTVSRAFDEGAGDTTEADHRTVRDLDVAWPSISVVVNAHNAASTLGECLTHCERLEYPKLDVVVVDDGSTDATPDIVRAHSRVQLVTIPRSGLSEGRNVGYRVAQGELIAYLDADAYPSPEWPWYIALAALGERLGGSGGPNVAPWDDPASARVVAASPGGPTPQLRGPDRAEHIPGCNMAFWRSVLQELHGFDPALESMEDVEFEWRLRDAGYELGYHPCALVWHHRRPGLGAYLRQQRHYGRGQAIAERRYPHRFPHGYRVRKAARRLFTRGAGRGVSYPVSYLSLASEQGALVELAHQWGVPAAIILGSTAPLGIVRRTLAAPALGAIGFVSALFAFDLAKVAENRRQAERSLGFRARAATFRLLRPLAFRWGHLRGWLELRAARPEWPPPPGEPRPETARHVGKARTPPAY